MKKISNSHKKIYPALLSKKDGAGFTFIELILYVAIVTIILSALVPFAWSAIQTGVKSSVQQEVNSNARYISERIKYEIRRASGITLPVTATNLTLTNFSPDTNTVITLSGGNITINKNGTGAVNLNSANTTITNPTLFTSYTSADGKTKHVQFTINVAASYGAVRQEYQDTVVIRGSAEVRSN